MGDAVLNAVDQGIYCLDSRGRTTFVNEAATRILGYTAREMMGKSEHELVHHHYADGSEFPEEACPIFASVTDGVHQRIGGDIFWRKDGTPVPVDYTSIPIREGRRVVAVVVTFRDVTTEQRARQHAERLAAEKAAREAAERSKEALEEAEERFRLALEAGQMGTWEWDIVGQRVLWSPQEERMYGLEVGTFSGTLEEYRQRIHPEDRDRSLAKVQEALAKRAPTHHIYHRIVRPSGEVRWLDSHGRFTYDASGRPLRLTGVSTDVTEKHLAAEHVWSELLRIFEQAPAAIATTQGPSHVFRTANALYRQLVGTRDLIGKSARDAFSELRDESLFDLLDHVYRTGEPYVGNRVRVALDRTGTGVLEEGTFNFVYQPLKGVDGSVNGIMIHAYEVEVPAHA